VYHFWAEVMKGPCRMLQVLSLPDMENKQCVFPDNAHTRWKLFSLTPQVMIWSPHQPKMNIERKREINTSNILACSFL